MALRQLEPLINELKNKKPDKIDSREVRQLKGFIRKREAISATRYIGIPDSNTHFMNLPFYETGRIKKNPPSKKDVLIAGGLPNQKQTYSADLGEDLDLITPILERLNGQPAILTGPHSADTLFHAAARQNYDAAIAMYHDQALIPIKTLDFDQGVNLTLGLPFIRTSPDHGTALDIAGRGIANPNSCIAALRLAEELGQKR